LSIATEVDNVIVETSTNDTIASAEPNHIIEVAPTTDLDVIIQKKEYIVTGDDIFLHGSGSATPQWLLDSINSIAELASARTLGDLKLAMNAINASLLEAELARNTYTESIMSEETIDGIVVRKLETLNSTLMNVAANIIKLEQTKATPEEASTLVLQHINSQIDGGRINSLVTDLKNTIANNQFTTASNISTIQSVFNDNVATLQEVDTALASETSVQAERITTLNAKLFTNDGLSIGSAGYINDINTFVGYDPTDSGIAMSGIAQQLELFQNQIDGKIDIFSGTDSPVLDAESLPDGDYVGRPSPTEPYATWYNSDLATNSIAERNKHTGDTYIQYKVVNDINEYIASWKFLYGSDTVDGKVDVDGFGWYLITDTTAANAYAEAIKAQTMADRKMTIYYQDDFIIDSLAENGDLLVLTADYTDGNGIEHFSGEQFTLVITPATDTTPIEAYWSKIINTSLTTAIATAQSAADIAQYTADGIIEANYYDVAPTANVTGSNGDWYIYKHDYTATAYMYDDSTTASTTTGNWHEKSNAIADAYIAARTAEATADGKLQMFYLDTLNSLPGDDGDIVTLTAEYTDPVTNLVYGIGTQHRISVTQDVNGLTVKTYTPIEDVNLLSRLADVQEVANSGVTLATTKISTYFGTTSTVTGTADVPLVLGDLLIDSTDNSQYMYMLDSDGTTKSWHSVQDRAIVTAQGTADSKIVTHYQDNEPEGMVESNDGDLWIDTNNGNKLWRYQFSNTQWVEVQDTSIAEAALLANQAQSTADGIVDATYATVAPTGSVVGNLGDWYIFNDDSRGGVATAYKCTAIDNSVSPSTYTWTQTNNAIADAFTKAKKAGDDSTRFYYQDDITVPNDVHDGDVLIIRGSTTLDDGTTYVYDTTNGWELSQDTDLLTRISTVKSDLGTLDGKVDAYYSDTEPTSPSEGDWWIDTTLLSPSVKRYELVNGVLAWVVNTTNTVGQAYVQAINSQAAADGKVTTFYASTFAEVVTARKGDILVKSTTVNGETVTDLYVAKIEINTSELAIESNWNSISNSSLVTGIAVAQSAALAAQGTADGVINATYSTVAPSTTDTDYDIGDWWINTHSVVADTNPAEYTVVAYRFDGTTWVESDNSVAKAYKAAKDAEAVADGKISSWYLSTYAISDAREGDILYYGSDNTPYRALKDSPSVVTDWSLIRDNSLATDIINLEGYVGNDNSVTNISYTNTAPSNANSGDWYVNTLDPNNYKAYRYDGTNWQLQEGALAQGYIKAAESQYTADGKLTVYRQESDPSTINTMNDGDMWIHNNTDGILITTIWDSEESSWNDDWKTEGMIAVSEQIQNQEAYLFPDGMVMPILKEEIVDGVNTYVQERDTDGNALYSEPVDNIIDDTVEPNVVIKVTDPYPKDGDEVPNNTDRWIPEYKDAGKIAADIGGALGGNSVLMDTIKVTADKVETNFKYGSNITLDGHTYKSGFGLTSEAIRGEGGNNPSYDSEFWINADKFKFTSDSDGTNSTPTFSIRNGETLFNGKVTFGNNQLGTIDEAISSTVNTVSFKDRNINITDNLIPTTSLIGSDDNAGYQFIGNPVSSVSVGADAFAEPQIALPSSSDEVYSPYIEDMYSSYYYKFAIKPGTDYTMSVIQIDGDTYTTTAIPHNATLVNDKWYIVEGLIQPNTSTNSSFGIIREADTLTQVGTVEDILLNSTTDWFVLGWTGVCTISQMKIAIMTSDTVTGILADVDYVDSQVSSIDLSPYVRPEEVADAINNNTTTINGSKITTGTILADRINTTGLVAETISATELTGKRLIGSYIEGAVIKASYLDLDGELEVLTNYHIPVSDYNSTTMPAAVYISGTDEYRIPSVSSFSIPSYTHRPSFIHDTSYDYINLYSVPVGAEVFNVPLYSYSDYATLSTNKLVKGTDPYLEVDDIVFTIHPYSGVTEYLTGTSYLDIYLGNTLINTITTTFISSSASNVNGYVHYTLGANGISAIGNSGWGTTTASTTSNGFTITLTTIREENNGYLYFFNEIKVSRDPNASDSSYSGIGGLRGVIRGAPLFFRTIGKDYDDSSAEPYCTQGVISVNNMV
jgi:hypothetical protein